uniref:Tetraspanin n=1 Tax=Romanomermis culicivorax TaxID=13658 RepID=A0A915IBD4_ROMCU
MIILAVEVAIAIYAAANRNNIEDVAKKTLIETLKYYGGTYKKKNAVRAAWDAIMIEHQCCGVNSTLKNEYASSEWYKKIFSVRYQGMDQLQYYPGDCCPNPNDKIAIPNAGTQDDLVCKNRANEGCYSKIANSLQNRLAIVIGVGFAVALIQLVGLIFALCLCRAITEED